MKNNVKLIAIIVLSIIGFGFMTTNSNYILDTSHTYVGFDVERFLVGEVSGRFNAFKADISMEGEDYSTLKMNAVVDVNSLDSNNKTRDGHLKGKMWLDAEAHSEIIFNSKRVSKLKDGSYLMKGALTIKGITKEIEFPIQIQGPFKDPTKKEAIGIKADFVIDRFDYGILFNKKMDNGSYFIGNEVKIKIRALAYKE